MTTNKTPSSPKAPAANESVYAPSRVGRELTRTELNSVAGGGLLSSPVGLSSKALLPASARGIIAILIGL